MQAGRPRARTVGRVNEETVIHQQAHDHAVACACYAGCLVDGLPAFMRLPVLNKHLDEPPQSLALDDVEHTPAQV